MDARRARKALVGAALGALLAACGGPGPSTPTHSPETSAEAAGNPGWRSAAIALPDTTIEVQGSQPAYCSPCHPPQATLLFGVADTPVGLLAVGVLEPPATAAVWHATDGTSWTRVADFPATPGTVADAVAAAGMRVVIVGQSATGAAAWTSADGGTWQAAPAQAALAGADGGTRMDAVVGWRGGFVAGGVRDVPATALHRGGMWRSDDGLHWRLVGGHAFDDAHVLGLAVGPDGLVAVGSTGDETHGSGAAWVSADGDTWTRSPDPALAGGILRSVTAGGPGLVAVGLGGADDRAMSWTSPDGSRWQVGPDSADLHAYSLPIRMVAVAAGPSGLQAVGTKNDGGNGSAVTWSSDDGVRWLRAPQVPSFSGAGMSGVAWRGTTVVAVGLAGYPDEDTATVWLGP